MISDFTAQFFGGNKNCVNAKFKLLLNHSSLIIMRVTFPWFVLCTRCYFFLLWFVPYVKMIIGLPLFYGSKLLLVYTLVVIKYNILEKFPDKLTLHHTVYIIFLAKVILDIATVTWNRRLGHLWSKIALFITE